MDRDGRNKTKTLYKRGSNYILSKPIVGNWLEDL